MVPALAAGTRSGTAFASARISTSTIRCEVSTFPPATAAGGRAFTIEPSGACSVSARRIPSVAGASSAQQAAQHIKARRKRDRANRIHAPATCGDDPAKSTSIVPAMRIDLAAAPQSCRGSSVTPSSSSQSSASKISCRHLLELRAHQPLRIIEQLLAPRRQLFHAVLRRQLQHPLLAHAARAHLRVQVALALLRACARCAESNRAHRDPRSHRAQSAPAQCESPPRQSSSPAPSIPQTCRPHPRDARDSQRKTPVAFPPSRNTGSTMVMSGRWVPPA